MDILNEIEEMKKRLAEIETEARKQKKTWEFGCDESIILANIDPKFKWLARDKDGDLNVYTCKPKKDNCWWDLSDHDSPYEHLEVFEHLFQSVQWTDKEPCEFRKFIEIQYF